MPVYNSFDFVRSENNKLISQALDAILAQTYQHFELIILDNQSTDDTPAICKEYAKKDARVRYIVDSEKRYPEGGITQAATFRNGIYTMVANDDDLWHPTYIEKMVSYMETHPDASMCYSNGTFVDVQNNIIGPINTTDEYIYSHNNSPISNFSTYILKRNPIPLAFGLFRSEVYSDVLPFEDFDNLKANVDNLFVAKFFLKGYRCHYVNELLFSYRRKERSLNPRKISDMPSIDKPLEIWTYYITHHYKFYIETLKKVDNSHCTQKREYYMRAVALQSFFVHSHRLIHWTHDHLAKQESKDKKIAKILADATNKQLKKNIENFPKLGNFPTDEKDNVRFHPVVLRNMFENIEISLREYINIIELYKKQEANSPQADKILEQLSEELREIKTIKESLSIEARKNPEILKKLEYSKSTPTQPTASVISTSFNLAKFLDDTIASIGHQTSTETEHIIIDGASKDDSLNILKKYPHLRVISEKDSGYPEALRKGITLAKGKYIIQCAVSDGLANAEWLEKCTKILNENPEISLVWGFPERLSEQNIPGGISYPQFHHTLAPQRDDLFSYWLMTGFYFPEGNLFVRKEVIDACYPDYKKANIATLDWLEFSYNFHKKGYLSYHLPIVANYGRTHGDQMGEHLARTGKIWRLYNNYLRRVAMYRLKILFGLTTPIFQTAQGEKIPIIFDHTTFRSRYFLHIARKLSHIDSRYLSPKKYKQYALKKTQYFIQTLKQRK